MPAQALYLKFRPRGFEDVIGQDHITRTLRNAIMQDRVRHAYLFNGPRGTGKTTMARILAKAVNCLHEDPSMRPCNECRFCEAVNEGRFLDLIEIDAASHNGVDDVRELRERIAFAPSEGRYKVYIIDEVHRFSGSAFDALLKTLEEPPDHAIFVLATTELDKVPATIKSRSLIFEFRRVSLREVADRLAQIVEVEGIQADREALEMVARQGTGSVRDSISLLDQLIADPTERITLEMAGQMLGTAGNRLIGALVQAILDNDVAQALDLLNQAIDEGTDPAQFGRQIVEYLRNLMIAKAAGSSLVDSSDEMRKILDEQAAQVSQATLVQAVRAFNGALGEIRSGWQPQLPLELALIESTRPVPDSVPDVPAPPRETKPTRKTKSAEKPAPEAQAAPVEEEAPVTAPRAKAAITLSQVQQQWPHIHRQCREQAQTLGALLDHVQVRALDKNTLVLAVNEDRGAIKDKLDTDDKRQKLAHVLKQVLGIPLQVKIVVNNAVGNGTITDEHSLPDPIEEIRNAMGGVVTNIEDSQGGV